MTTPTPVPEIIEKELLLDVRNLETHFTTKERGVLKAVNDVSFQVHRGETVGIVGESGSGKSVTSLSIMRLIQSPGDIASGQIIFQSPSMGEVDLVQLSREALRGFRGNEISMIFQEPMTSLNPVFTCGNQVAEALILHRNISKKEAKKRTIQLFKNVQLPRPEAIYDTYPHEISGGQKQRVMIAMAMSCNPALMIADEPTTALDVTVQRNILNLMDRLRKENDMGLIFITHDLGVVAEIADRVIVMYQGKIVEQGDVMDIFSNPKHPYTKGLLACRPRLDLKMKVLPVVSDFMQRDAATGELSERTDSKFSSIGEALLLNYVTEEEVEEHNAMLAKQPPILEIKNLKTYFPINKGLFGKAKEFVKAVDDVSFHVYPGETVGLVGESGCGKTTLGRTILRLADVTAGQILFQGRDITSISSRQMRGLRKDIQIIFQDPYSSLNPRITIGQAIMEPMKVHGVLDSNAARRDKVYELLETVSMPTEVFNRYPHEFSGGQRQRISIARALALEPKFIICDESVSALDVSVQAQVLNLLNRLKEQFGFTYIFISHDLSVVKFMSDRIIVMNQGKIEEMGFAEDIYQNPQKEYTKTLIRAIPKGDLEDIRQAQLRRKMAMMGRE